MRTAVFRVFIAISLAGGLLTGISGCGVGGEKLVVIRGRVVENGQPLRLEYGGPRVELSFHPVDAAGNPVPDKMSYSCSVQQDGTFVMDGIGKGIPAGRYKIAVRGEPGSSQYDPRAPKAVGGDIYEGRFSLQKTPFIFEFTSNQEITIDLAKGGGSQQAPPEAQPTDLPSEG